MNDGIISSPNSGGQSNDGDGRFFNLLFGSGGSTIANQYGSCSNFDTDLDSSCAESLFNWISNFIPENGGLYPTYISSDTTNISMAMEYSRYSGDGFSKPDNLPYIKF